MPPTISIGTAGTGMPSCVTSTLANTAHGPSDAGTAWGKCHTKRTSNATNAEPGGMGAADSRDARRGACAAWIGIPHSKRVS
ncbi:hypothetical protein DM56_1435 [Burkholderia mallei]|uniref:hypothetical protein n=1 Tax=Burkholderia pseudomallei TaxID=28450 RepID=UPI0006C186A6|nr:hypothetical protein [Burkholderia pseudomallei]KOT05931.1 hypothetical protein DM56_1435 [Burkholderia mallei]